MNYADWMKSMPKTDKKYIDDAAPEDWSKYDAEYEKWCFEGRHLNLGSHTNWEPTRSLVNDLRYELGVAKTDILDLKSTADGYRRSYDKDLHRLRKALKISAASNILLAAAFIIHVVNNLFF